ncbi:Uncharacterised protein [Halioglobus japonicus]|nr:Uncharacterised protein [Halioglobus japonicus]
MQFFSRKLLALLLVGSFGLFALSACEQDGPAEELGEKVDEAAADAKRKLDDATD